MQQNHSENRPKTKTNHYFTRRHTSHIRTNDLPYEVSVASSYLPGLTPVGVFFVCIKLTVPLAYLYIGLILLREICIHFPESIYDPIQFYLPMVGTLISTMKKSSLLVEAWAVVEAIFYIYLRLRIWWLQNLDPLEACLSAAPMLEPNERRELWDRMVEVEKSDPAGFISGWFFDRDIKEITRYDVMDFLSWSLFEGRNLEHLTRNETRQLDWLVDDLEYYISVQKFGLAPENNAESAEDDTFTTIEPNSGDALGLSHISRVTSLGTMLSSSPFPSASDLQSLLSFPEEATRQEPKQWFRFVENSDDETQNFFSNLYINFKQRYGQYRQMLESSDFRPVQELRNFVAEKGQQLREAEENAMATASNIYDSAYFSLVTEGSNMDKQIAALSHATQMQLTEAWNSVREMKGRLVTADSITTQRKALEQQLKGYRVLLDRMRDMSSSVPTNQMADLMRKITKCNDSLEGIESSAREAFVKATGFARQSLFTKKEPTRYAKYSYDPLLGISTYPLVFHALVLGLTEGALRVFMAKRGFERRNIGQISYYHHPGNQDDTSGLDSIDEDKDKDEGEDVPIVFCHGIGIGLIAYAALIDELLKSGRPVLLPEIPYVCGFRPWQSPNSILSPAAAVSTLSSMLATHGYLRGTFMGHSYGTSWLSYMCKYAPAATAGLVFLDPICFCLHYSRLTKKFVYHRADPGTVSYMLRTDLIVNWTIQRSFPWAFISLFTEQFPPGVTCSVFLSSCDDLVPSNKVELYLRSKGAVERDLADADSQHFAPGSINLTMFHGDGHGDWTFRPSDSVKVAAIATSLPLPKLSQ